ncbi:hypothetical protein [Nodularia spumigena]|nr:hypothetical protein [Nodularia spumigena]MDB9349308.1 hypothetical protein [Nodularia spumigena CS-588/01]
MVKWYTSGKIGILLLNTLVLVRSPTYTSYGAIAFNTTLGEI